MATRQVRKESARAGVLRRHETTPDPGRAGRNRGRQLYALSQGVWDLPNDPANAGAPASHDTGTLLRVKKDGTFASVAGELDQPTSVDFIKNTAYVVTLTGKVIKITNVGAAPFGNH